MTEQELKKILEDINSASKYGLYFEAEYPVSDSHPNLVVVEKNRWFNNIESDQIRYIIHNKETDQYFSLFSHYESYNGEDWYSIDPKEVRPSVKTITVYD